MDPPKREQNVSSLSKRGSLLLQKANLLVRRKEESKSDPISNGPSTSTPASSQHRRRRMKKVKEPRNKKVVPISNTTVKSSSSTGTHTLNSVHKPPQLDSDPLPNPDVTITTKSPELTHSKLHQDQSKSDQDKPMLLPYTGKIRNPLIDADSSPSKHDSTTPIKSLSSHSSSSSSDTPQNPGFNNEVGIAKLTSIPKPVDITKSTPLTATSSVYHHSPGLGQPTSSRTSNGNISNSCYSMAPKSIGGESVKPTPVGRNLSRKSLDGTVINHDITSSFNSESNTTLNKTIQDDSSTSSLTIPKDSEREMLFEFAGLKVHVFHDQLTDKVPEIGASGRMLGHGTLLIFHINNGMMIYLLCGSLFVYPLLPKSKILRIGFNTFMLPLVNPERYWRITLDTDDVRVIELLECVLKEHISYRKLYQDTEPIVSDEYERNRRKDSVEKKGKSGLNNQQQSDVVDRSKLIKEEYGKDGDVNDGNMKGKDGIVNDDVGHIKEKGGIIKNDDGNVRYNDETIQVNDGTNGNNGINGNDGKDVNYTNEAANNGHNIVINGHDDNPSDYSNYDDTLSSRSPVDTKTTPRHKSPLDIIPNSFSDEKNLQFKDNPTPDILTLTPLEVHNRPPLPQATPTPQGTSFLSVAIPDSPPSAPFSPTVSTTRQTSTPLMDRNPDSPVLGLPAQSIHQPRPQHINSTGAWSNPFRVDHHATTFARAPPSVKSDSLMDSLIDEYEEGMTSSILNVSRPLSRPASRLSQGSRTSYRRNYVTNGIEGVEEGGFPTTSLSQYHRAHLARKTSVVSDNGNVPHGRGTIVRSRSNQSVSSIASGSALTSIYRLVAERNLTNRLDTDDVRLIRLSRSRSKLPPVLKSAFAAVNNNATRYSNSVVGERSGGLNGDQVYRMLKQAEKPKKQLFFGW